MKFRSRDYLQGWRVGGKVIRVSKADKRRKRYTEREMCRGTPPVFSWIMIKHVKKNTLFTGHWIDYLEMHCVRCGEKLALA